MSGPETARIEGILFDKDGTLVDFTATWGPAIYASMRILAEDDPAALARLTAAMRFDDETLTFHADSPMIAGATADYADLWAEALGRPGGDAFLDELTNLFRIEGLKTLTPIGEPASILAALADDGFRLGIATNDAEASARAQSAALRLDPFLGFVAGCDSGFGRKPHPGMVTAFARHHGLAPGSVALVGDTLHDVHAAREAGAVSIAVLSGPQREAARADLEPHADHVIDSIADLPAWLRARHG